MFRMDRIESWMICIVILDIATSLFAPILINLGSSVRDKHDTQRL